ncbi:hypothetical protein I553_3152 [Mycobacterium xenopi 4042]|uniref:Uncharacterized protein n=1 Tax=Mycobacterium xenopi 4042 TaxID=1299334 RepID=X8E607_MYCXE|nr:hypothetical protein I553_3152 [Mycobacterium xenopi 4042]
MSGAELTRRLLFELHRVDRNDLRGTVDPRALDCAGADAPAPTTTTVSPPRTPARLAADP